QPCQIEEATIIIEAVRVRRGHQLRLVVPGPRSATPVRRDTKLIALVAEAHHARELVLASPTKPLSRIAQENGRCRARLARLVTISCLEPQIVKAIVEGRQPEQFSASR